MRKHGIDTEDPDTVDYATICAYVEKSMASEKASKRMCAEKVPNADQKDKLEERVGRFQTAVADVAKEKRLEDPVVNAQPVVSTATEKKMDKLMQSFEKLNINIGALMQQSSWSQQPPYPYPYLRSVQPGPYHTGQNVEAAMQMMYVNTFTMGRQNMENTCFYCFNRNPKYPPHRFRNRCLWYLYHLEKGTAHLNANDKLCFGLVREGAPEIRLRRGRPHGEQVQQQTAGTEYDEYLDG